MKFWYLFFHSLWLNCKPQAILWRSRCWELEIWAQGLAYTSWKWIFFSQSSDWTSNLMLLCEGLIVKNLKWKPKAWLIWVEILKFFFQSSNWTSNLKAWPTWAKYMMFFSFFVLELQTSSCFIKVSLLRAWNLSLGFGSHELKFWLFFLHSL